MTAEYKNWQEEFVDINFTDQRLKSRFFKIIDAFAASPGKSTWAATGSRSSAKAAYRFFSNSEISKDELLDSISRATVEKIKCADAEWILAVQDTTAVGFGDRKAIHKKVHNTIRTFCLTAIKSLGHSAESGSERASSNVNHLSKEYPI